MIQRFMLRHAQVAKPITRSQFLMPQTTAQNISRRLPSIAFARATPSRHYSAAPEAASTSPDADPAPPGTKEEEDPIQKDRESKNREIIDLKQDRYLRSVADFRNLQDRTKRDVQSARDYAIQKFASDLIESIDNLDRALTTVPPSKLAPQNSDPDSKPEEKDYNKDLANLYDGLKMTETILM
ncbi:MAG: hypothetical protein Q9174_005589, partial [Haloplaca sp. 1 TL-2023]